MIHQMYVGIAADFQKIALLKLCFYSGVFFVHLSPVPPHLPLCLRLPFQLHSTQRNHQSGKKKQKTYISLWINKKAGFTFC